MTRPTLGDERGASMVLFAVLLPLFLIITAIVWDAGNWWVHRKHLQTKVDASAFAGGGVWEFPCVEDATQGPTSTQKIVDEARKYVGPHTQADGALFTATTFNPQVGGTDADQIHVVLNGSTWWDDDALQNPQDRQSPLNPSVCQAMTLDVKATEANNSPLFGWLPFTPDIKRRARVEIQQIEGLNGLLPIAVRVPRPLSAAAVFYNETPGPSYGNILAVQYFCEDTNNSIFQLPAGLGGWSTYDPSDPSNPQCASSDWANINIGQATGVAVATSFRPRCGVGPAPCMEDSGWIGQPVDSFCRQASGTVQCFYGTGSGTTQTARSGLQFIRGYNNSNVTDGPPELQHAWLDAPSPAGCGLYFSATAVPCTALLQANFDFGSALDQNLHPGAAADIKYGVVYGTTGPTGADCLDGQNRPNCDMSGSPSASATVTFDPRFDNQGDPAAVRHAIVIRVRLTRTTIGPPGPGQITCPNNPSATCQWFFTSQPGQTSQANATNRQFVFDHPVQRSFTGDDNLTAPIKWLRLTTSSACSGLPDTSYGEAASLPTGNHCFYLEMGLRGAIAQDQDEPAFGFNFKGSQSGGVDCDDGWPNFKTEVIESCRPFYAANDFTRQPPAGPCPWPEGTQVSWTTFMAPPPPYDAEWPAYTCLRTDGPPAPGQVEKGLKGRFFGNETATLCPQDNATEFVKGRNYWDDDNNQSGGLYAFADQGSHPNNLHDDDPRQVTLFLTAYTSFGGSGGAIYAIVGFGNFYISGFGKATGGGGMQIDDPCPGSTLPPDLVINSGLSGAEFVWGHFINDVVPNPSATPSGVLCNPGGSFMPCVATLVE